MENEIEIIILCGGICKRWNNYLGIEKHFVVLEGEALIGHTLRLLTSHNTHITLVTREDTADSYRAFNQRIVTISIDKSTLEYYKIKSTFGLWNPVGRTIIMMGDVWYTPQSIDKIVSTSRPSIVFFGRQRKNYHTKCNHGELFAISFGPEYHDLLQKAEISLERLILYQGINISGGWGIYNIVSGLEFLMAKERIVMGKALYFNFINLIDNTDDIDSPKDYENIQKALLAGIMVRLLNAIKMNIYYFILSICNYAFETKLKLLNKD